VWQDAEPNTVKGIDFFVTKEFGQNLYDSCKDVKFAAMNTRAMDFIGGGAINYTGKIVLLSVLAG
jgi:Niemann-Pick C1 protein